jgi:5-hydroxyisourate hydrolase-like protein (transthyretin family)
MLALALPAAADTFAGKVVEDHSGDPLASVELRVARDGVRQLVADLETDADGRFQAEGIPPGEYQVEISKANYVPSTLRVRVGSGAMLIRLVRFGVISGRVADPDGKPIPGSRIAVVTRGPGGVLRPFGAGVQVDDRGQYRIYNLPPGEYAVALAYGAAGGVLRSSVGSGAQLYPSTQRPQWFAVAGGEDYSNTDFVVMAAALFKVSGTVQPAGPMYEVALTPADQPLLSAASQRMESGKGFSLEGIPPGSYDLYATGPVQGYGLSSAILGPEPVFGKTRVNVGGQDVEGLTVSAERGRSASFILRTASPRQPASACPPTATLSLSAMEATGAMLNRTVEASFAKAQKVDDLAPVRYWVSAGRVGDACYSVGAVADLTSDSDELIAVTVAPAASIRGKLAGAARPADFVVTLVSAEPAEGAPAVQAAYPDAESRFAFGNLRPGRYRIGAQPAAEAAKAPWVAGWANMIELDLPGGVPTDIDLPAPVARKNP